MVDGITAPYGDDVFTKNTFGWESRKTQIGRYDEFLL